MRILVCHPEGSIASNPTLRAILLNASSRGIGVDYFAPAHRRTELPGAPGSQARHRWLDNGERRSRLERGFANRLGSRRLTAAYGRAWSRRLPSTDWERVIGIDRMGLVQAAAVSRHRRIPMSLVSFELTFRDEIGARAQSVEKVIVPGVETWLIQDTDRERQARLELALPAADVLVPVADWGPAPEASGRLRDDLGIPSEAKVAIMMGSLERWTMTQEIVASLGTWPRDWYLIVHQRYGNTRQELSDLGADVTNAHLRVSEGARSSTDDLGYLLAGVDAGLAFYRPSFESPLHGRNLEVLGRASGKIATYARHGVPIVCNDIGMAAQDVRAFGAGVVVDHPRHLPDRLDEVTQQHGLGSRAYFDEVLDYEHHRARVESALLHGGRHAGRGTAGA